MSDLNNFHTSKLLIISSTEHPSLVNYEYNEIFYPNCQIVEQICDVLLFGKGLSE